MPRKKAETTLEQEVRHDIEADVQTDQRAPDQDAAMEAAFVEGRLPEEDRRHAPPAQRTVYADERGLTQVPLDQPNGTTRWQFYDGAGEPVTVIPRPQETVAA